MAEIVMVRGSRWTGADEYTFTNDRGDVAVIIGTEATGVWLYPKGLDEYGRANVPGHHCAGLLSAQIEAIEILSHD